VAARQAAANDQQVEVADKTDDRLGVGRLPLAVLGKTSGPRFIRRVPPGLSASGASKREIVSAKKRPLFLVADPFVFMSSGSRLGGGLCRRPKTLPVNTNLRPCKVEVFPVSETLPVLPTSSHTRDDAVVRRSEQQQCITRQCNERDTTQTLLFLPVLSSDSCPTARSRIASRPITPLDANLLI
jgi:hypothetical protein